MCPTGTHRFSFAPRRPATLVLSSGLTLLLLSSLLLLFFFFRILELPSWTSIDNVLTVTFLPVSVTISETLYNRNLQNDSRAFFRLSSSFCPHDPSFGSLIVNSSETRVKFREIQIAGGCVIARTDATRKWEDGKGPDKHEASRLFEGYGHTRVVT